MLSKFVVLGGGSAGLLAALCLQRTHPHAKVQVIYSSEIGTIGVGESTTPNLPTFIFEGLGIPSRRFYELAEPTWKLGIKFIWGPRPSFNYTFRPQLDARLPEMRMPTGYYFDKDFPTLNVQSALMNENKMFLRKSTPTGEGVELLPGFAFHLENRKFVYALEVIAKERGIEMVEGRLRGTERGPNGIAALVLEDGRRFYADLFIDASGFKSELLGKELQEPFISYQNTLINDRSIVGGWERAHDEPTHPYTTAETMNHGWAWRIDHENIINRGYVYSSSYVSDDEARAEFAAKNPKAKISDRVIKFQTGRYRRVWAENVVAVGNACGFAEPLEATSLMLICWQCDSLCSFLKDMGTGEKVHDLYNRAVALSWDETRDFIAMHYKFNTRLDTPYWKRAVAETDIGDMATFVELYKEAGPSGLNRYNLANPVSQFALEGPAVMLVGNQVPYARKYQPKESEIALLRRWEAHLNAQARSALTVKESLQCIRNPGWRWADEPALQASRVA